MNQITKKIKDYYEEHNSKTSHVTTFYTHIFYLTILFFVGFSFSAFFYLYYSLLTFTINRLINIIVNTICAVAFYVFAKRIADITLNHSRKKMTYMLYNTSDTTYTNHLNFCYKTIITLKETSFSRTTLLNEIQNQKNRINDLELHTRKIIIPIFISVIATLLASFLLNDGGKIIESYNQLPNIIKSIGNQALGFEVIIFKILIVISFVYFIYREIESIINMVVNDPMFNKRAAQIHKERFVVDVLEILYSKLYLNES